MSFPREEFFPQNERLLSAMDRTLGYPARLHILRLLYDVGPQYFSEIVGAIPLSAATISEHLKKLRIAGFITVEEQGLKNKYALNPSALEDMWRKQVDFLASIGIVVTHGIVVTQPDENGRGRS